MRKFILGIGVAALVFAQGGRATEAPYGPAGHVTALVGDQAWGEAFGRKREPLRVGSTLYAGERLTTGDGTFLTVVVDPKDVALWLRPNTSAKLARTGGADWTLSLDGGSVLTAVRNPEKRPHHFNLKTRSATMGVRGTVFFVKDEGKKGEFLCTCVGTVAVESPDGHSRVTLTSKHHDAPKQIGLGRADIAGRMSPAPMGEDHTDADAKALLAALGE